MSISKIEEPLDDNVRRLNMQVHVDAVLFNLGQAVRFLAQETDSHLARIEQRLHRLEGLWQATARLEPQRPREAAALPPPADLAP